MHSAQLTLALLAEEHVDSASMAFAQRVASPQTGLILCSAQPVMHFALRIPFSVTIPRMSPCAETLQRQTGTTILRYVEGRRIVWNISISYKMRQLLTFFQFWSSLSPAIPGDQDNYLSCGECFELIRTKADGTDYAVGEDGYTDPIYLEIVDSCPCDANSKWCCTSSYIISHSLHVRKYMLTLFHRRSWR